MHILYIHQYFATPHGGTGTRSFEFARRWVRRGHRVTMLTSQAQLTPDDLRSDEAQGDGRGTRAARMRIEGIEVIALRVPYHQTMSAAARAAAFARFMLGSLRYALMLPETDVVYASSTPLTVGAAALAAWWLRRRPFVFEVRDLWPDVPVAFGAIRSRLVRAGLRVFERRIYAGARAIVALAPPTAELIRARSPGGRRIEIVPNAADTQTFSPGVDGRPLRQRMGWADRFVCLHAGAMGPANGLSALVRCAQRLRDDRRCLIVLVGEGSARRGLEEEVRRLGLTNVEFVDRQPKARMPEFFAAADVCLVTVAPVPIMEHNSANKLFDALAAGKPVLINYGGWQRDLLESSGAGLGCPLGDEPAFTAALQALMDDAPRCADMGRCARRLAETYFDRDLLAARVLQLLEDVAG